MSEINTSKNNIQSQNDKQVQPHISEVPGEKNFGDNYVTRNIQLSFNPKLYKLLKSKYKDKGSMTRYIRELIHLDVSWVVNYDDVENPKHNIPLKIPLSLPIYKILPRRADQAMCLNSTDYVRTLVYADLIMSGDMNFTLATDLTKD